MGVLIPADFDLRTLDDAAERQVVENLRDRLSDSWYIIPRLDISQPSRPYEIDVLIFHEGWGIAGIEVKKGSVRIQDGEWYKGPNMMSPSPMRQASNACYALRDELRLRYEGFEHLEIQYGVALPECADVGNVPIGALRDQILFQEDLRNTAPRIHDMMLSKWNIGPLTRDQIEKFVDVVRPDIDFTWDPEAQARDARISLNAIMREQVRALATLDMNTNVLVHGAAGTGKTQLALQWAQRAIDRGERVLLTCYNVPLGQHLAAMFEHNENVVVGNFVDVISAIPGMPPLVVPGDAGTPWYQHVPVAHIVEHGPGLAAKFDTIIVDETQDFYGEWITALPFLLADNGPQRLLMVGDSAQNLFGRDAFERVDELLPSEAELTLNCRNTQEIGGLLRSLGGARVANASPDGQGVFHIEVNNTDELLVAIASELEDLVGEKNINPANILIITSGRDDRDAIRAASPGGFTCSTWEEREDQNIVCETVHRTKGLEFDAVIFATTSATVKDELLYVGASRAVSLLTVIAPLPVAERLGIA